ncbi:DMT family transporter [Nocardia acidivorans]|uniref:DMT family transporter n=1 Tax=Nocardia acidivorans TaxID=404580 RepID=UPI000833EADC|nr:multidrug efflux SMR transporter [Nocardia acidivorans]
MTTPSTYSEQPAAVHDQNTRGWLTLLIAGVVEIGYAVTTGGSKGFSDPSWSIAAAAFFFLTVFTLTLALKSIDVGIGYAVWTGIGSSGAAVVSSIVFHQSLTPLRILWLAVIIGGVVVLKLASNPKAATTDQPAARSGSAAV